MPVNLDLIGQTPPAQTDFVEGVKQGGVKRSDEGGVKEERSSGRGRE